MKRRRSALIIIALALSAVLVMTGCTTGSSYATQKNFITVGCVCPLTGELSKYGEGSLQIEEDAVKEINENGGLYIDDIERKLKIRFVIRDSQSTKEGAKEAARGLIEEDNIDVMICSSGIETAIPVSGVCEEYKLPCFITGADLDIWNAEGPFEYCFNSSATLDARFQAIYDAMLQSGASSIGLVAKDERAGYIFADKLERFCQAAKIGYNGAFYLNENSRNIAGFGGRNGQALICYMDGEMFNSAWEHNGLNSVPAAMYILADDCVFPSDLDSIKAGTDVKTVYTTACWDRIYSFGSSLTEEDGPALALAWEDEYVSPVPEALGLKHAAVEVMVDALKLAMSVDAESVVSAALSLKTDTVVGEVDFNEEHGSPLPCSIFKWTYDVSAGEGVWIKELVSAARVGGLEIEY